jgi:transcriptional regulator with XRE-family HTH domain
MDRLMLPGHHLPMVKRRKPIARTIEAARTGLPIVAWLKFSGKSQTWLAEETGYSEPYISLLASGKKRYNQDHLERFSEVLGIQPSMLLHKPTEEDFWSLWNSLSVDQRRRAKALVKAIRDMD